MDDDIAELKRLIELVVRLIPGEERARDLYRKTAASTASEKRRILFEHLATEEAGHVDKLEATLQILQKELAELKKSQR